MMEGRCLRAQVDNKYNKLNLISIIINITEGFGVIDCTDGCPGTEEEFKHFREVMEDKEFASKYPEINKMVKKEKKKEEDNKGSFKKEKSRN